MAVTNRLLNFVRCSHPLLNLNSRVVTSPVNLSHQRVRWCSVKYDDKYYKQLVTDNPLVLFMKGSPSSPMCGFSRLVVQILHMHGLDKYDHHDILHDQDFKEGMKTFSNWPTFPQVYMNGDLVGGADIMLQLHQSGELIEELNKVGHKSALLEKVEE